MQETWVRSLGWEDPLEKGTAARCSILAWKIPGTEEPGGLQSTELQRVVHDWAAIAFIFIFSLDIKLANNKNYHCITYGALLYITIKIGSRCYYYYPISWKMKLKLKDIWQPTQA